MSIQIVRPKKSLKRKIHKIRLKMSLRRRIHKIKLKISLKRYEKLHLQTVRNEFRLNQFITLRLIDELSLLMVLTGINTKFSRLILMNELLIF